jgi:hypothetical protein
LKYHHSIFRASSFVLLSGFGFLISNFSPAAPPPLSPGVAFHSFDHLGEFNNQADTAAASGCNITYITGMGSLGYTGLPATAALDDAKQATAAYNHHAKQQGIQLSIAYVCATSIVNLKTFSQNWTPDFRAQFSTPPADWLQQDKDGHPLPSWYGGDYRPACMNNPDWRKYEHAIVSFQIRAGSDGIFFDNPTVHPQGCYCPFCMKKFAAYLAAQGATDLPSDIPALRHLAVTRSEDFLRFRGTIARDFISDMRSYARTINPDALVTCNNSLNSPEVFFSQCRDYGYNIDQLAQAEDWILLEDMGNQPRTLPAGQQIEYAPTYELIHSISHDKPIVAITIADADYHTPPNLTRLAMAEAAAHNASYLLWPTWPENIRSAMSSSIRSEADFLRTHADLMSIPERADVILYLPYQTWPTAKDCHALTIARALTANNISYKVTTDSSAPAQGVLLDFPGSPRSIDTSKPDWLTTLRSQLPSAITTTNPSLRVTIHDDPARTVVHLLNLNIQKISSYQDKIVPLAGVKISFTTPLPSIKTITAFSADPAATQGPIPFTIADHTITLSVPAISISTILVIE